MLHVVEGYEHDTIEGASNWMAGSFLDRSLRWVAEHAARSPGYSYIVAPPSAKDDLDGDADVEALSSTAALAARLRLYEGHVFGGLSALVFTALTGRCGPSPPPYRRSMRLSPR